MRDRSEIAGVMDNDMLETEPQMISANVPLVRVVLVAHDPGEWFEEVLVALGAQDHRELEVLVVDAGKRKGLAERVTPVLPWAEIVPFADDCGFGEAANVVLQHPQVGVFHLFLHDDLVLDGTAVRRMVECAMEANAGVIGPKIFDGSESQHLEDMGAWVDRYGGAVPRFDKGEVDQGQYDADREVFACAESAVLVRTDLFYAVEGFDPEVHYFDGALDLCWRARLAGAIVMTEPTAVGWRIGGRRIRRGWPDPQRLRPRHRLRLTLVNQEPLYRGLAIGELALATLFGVVCGLFTGRFRHIRGLLGSWTWNLARLRSARERRDLLKPHFQGDQARLYVRHRVPHRSFRRAVTGRASVGTGSEAPGRLRLQQLWAALLGPGGATLLVGGVVLGFGSRHLVISGLPSFGRFQAFPLIPWDLVQSWWTGWRSTGTGIDSPPSEVFLFLGLLSRVVPIGAENLLSLAVLAAFPVGAVGIWRLVQPIGGGRSRAVAVLTYLAVPLPYNAMAEGRLAPLAAYAFLPWIARRFAVAQGVVPYGKIGSVSEAISKKIGLLEEVLVGGLVITLAIAFEPSVALLGGLVFCGLVSGSLLAGSSAGLARLVVVTFASVVVAALVHLPRLDRVARGDFLSAFIEPTDWKAGDLNTPEIFLLDTGPFGLGYLGCALLVAPLVALWMARGWYLAVAIRAWFVAVAGFGLTWFLNQGWWSGPMPAAELVLIPAALGLSWAAAVGVASIGVKVSERSFGWGHLARAVTTVAVSLMVVPVVVGSLDGRWGLPEKGLDAALPIFDESGSRGSGRVIWLGDPSLLPAAGVIIQPGLAMAVTDGPPNILDQSPLRVTDGLGFEELQEVVVKLMTGRLSRFGGEVADWGVENLVIVNRSAAAPYAANEKFPPAELVARLDRQLDLRRVGGLNRAVIVYRNTAVEPIHAVVRDRTGRATPVSVERLAWGRLEITSPVAGTYRAKLGPSDWWKLSYDREIAPTSNGSGGLPVTRVKAGETFSLALDNGKTNTVYRKRQVVIFAMLLVVTSWAYFGRVSRREE